MSGSGEPTIADRRRRVNSSGANLLPDATNDSQRESAIFIDLPGSRKHSGGTIGSFMEVKIRKT
jgi:hypothetical protein